MVLEGRAGKCEVCDKQAKSRCSGCVQAFYCSVEHQRQDWKIHKFQCSPMKVCHNDKVGRYYVATRNIKPGEILLREMPLVIGPSQQSGPVCVGCLKVRLAIFKCNSVMQLQCVSLHKICVTLHHEVIFFFLKC